MTQTPPPGGGRAAEPSISRSVRGNTNSEIDDLKKKLKELEKFCLQLKVENQKLKEESNISNSSNTKQTSNINPEQYETDEEDLARETDWILKKSKRQSKKRKAEESPEMEHINSFPLRIQNATVINQSKKRDLRPPPIMVSNVENYQDLRNLVQKAAKSHFAIKLLNNETYKINASSSDDYRSITKMLTISNSSWYSYEDKQTRPIKVMIKNLHHSCTPISIVADIKEQGFNITNVVNKLKWKTREPLNMFLATFDSTEDIKKIYEIKYILHSVVIIEPVKNSKVIPQCKNCQAFGHTRNFCGKSPRCVKCSGKHKTIECTKEMDEKPKCCNCGEDHPANYRGCVIAKELQKMRNKTGQKQNTATDNQPNNIRPVNMTKHNNSQAILHSNRNKPTLSDVVKGKGSEKLVITKTQTKSEDILAQILNKLNKQEVFNTDLQKRLNNLEQKLKTLL